MRIFSYNGIYVHGLLVGLWGGPREGWNGAWGGAKGRGRGSRGEVEVKEGEERRWRDREWRKNGLGSTIPEGVVLRGKGGKGGGARV